MLEGLRVASQNWVGRAIMGLVMGFIAISFAIWGIGDVFRGFTSSRLVKVGRGEVTVEAFRSNYQNELRHLQQKLRRAITNEEARRAGLDQQVLERLITDAALNEKINGLGLAISDEEVQRLIKSEPTFRGLDGQFDAARFKQVLQDAGYTERSFLAEQKGAYLRKELTDTVAIGVEPPRLMIEAIFRFRNEARAVDYFVLPLSAAGEIAKPSDEELKKYYDEHEPIFRAKEYRALTVLAATPAMLGKAAEVPEGDVRKLYDEVKAKRYGTPEKRAVRQIVFKTEDEAKDAIARLKGGLSFDALIAERKLNPKDVDLGTVEQRDFGDASVGAAAFALPAPGLAEPVKTAFGVVVSDVRKIVPGVYSKTYEQAAPELRNEIAMQKAAPEARRMRDAVEEQRTAGKTLAEAAKAVGLEARTVEAVDDAGRDKSGKDVDLPGGADLVKAAFASDVGVDNDTVATRDGGYVWFEVAKIEPARQKNFEEVKDAVEAAIKADAAQKALNDRANELAEKLRSGRPIDDLAHELGLEVKRVTDVKRAPRNDLTPATIVQFFNAPPRGAGTAQAENGKIVFFVREATTPQFDPASLEAKMIAEQLKPAMVNDVLEQYVGGLEKALNVEINQKLLQMATGADAEK